MINENDNFRDQNPANSLPQSPSLPPVASTKHIFYSPELCSDLCLMISLMAKQSTAHTVILLMFQHVKYRLKTRLIYK